MKIAIYGMGYVGLTLAAVLSEQHEVVGVDTDAHRLGELRGGHSPIYEPGLDKALPRIHFTDSSPKAEVHIICVGTPPAGTLTAVEAVVRSIAAVAQVGDVVIFRSTVPVGTTRKMAALLPDNVQVAYAPERTLAGKALEELRTLPQIVAGSSRAAFLFRGMTKGGVVLMDDYESAEMVKLVDNCWRAWSFAFANQLAYDCSRLGLDLQHVREGAIHKYPRAGAIPAPGFTGGTCLTKDPVIYGTMFGHMHPFELARNINRNIIFQWITSLDLFGPKSEPFWESTVRIGVIGRAFKADPPTNDARDSFSTWLDSYEIKHEWWDPLLGGDWDSTWRDKDVVILAHPMCVEGLKGPHLMAEGGVVLDLWGKNSPTPRMKVFGA